MIAFKTGHCSVTVSADAASGNEPWPCAGSMDSKTADTPDPEEQPNALLQTETERFP
jgi:hypothetical protein